MLRSILMVLVSAVLGSYIIYNVEMRDPPIKSESRRPITRNPLPPPQPPYRTSSPSRDDPSVPYNILVERIKDSHVVNIGTHSPNPPMYTYVSPQIQVGFEYEVAKLIFNQDEFRGKIRYRNKVQMVFDEDNPTLRDAKEFLYAKNEDGDYDVDMVSTSDGGRYTAGQGVIYSIPYLERFGLALVVARNSEATSLQDFAGKRIGISAGNVHARDYIARHLPSATIVEFPEYRYWLADAIGSGKVDAIVHDSILAKHRVRATGLRIPVFWLEGSSAQYRFAFRTENIFLRGETDKAIRKVLASEEYNKLIEDYLP